MDLEQFADYLINQFFLGNQDWPSRNWYALRERTPDAGFQFFVWDSEYTLAKQAPLGTTDVNKTYVSNANSPGFLYSRLRTNPEFIRLFGDRVQKHLFGEGVLTVSALQQRYSELAEVIDRAIVGESARWGDHRESVSGVTYTRDEHWVSERDDLINNFIPERHAVVLQQFRDAGLYPDVVAPAFEINDSERLGGQITAGDLLSMITPETVSFTETMLVAAGDAVRAFVPNVTNTFDAGPGPRWYENGFDPATDGLGLWTDGSSATGVGYEDSADLFDSLIQTDISANWNLNESSVYLRIRFDEIVDPDQFDQLSLDAKYDDGFVAYLNGQEVLRGAGEGTNVLAIQGLNWSASSSDLLIVPQLIGGVQEGLPTDVPIWFTTDGSDPRDAVTGSPSIGAMLFEDPLPLNSTATVRARALDNTQWSALNEALFSVDVPLRISGILYHPGNPSPDEMADGFTDDDDFEFIELVHIGSNTINLDGIRFSDGIGFTFGDIDLDPNDRIMVVRNTLAIESRYAAGLNIAGQYSGGQTAGGLFGLSNNRETIVLHDAGGAVIQEFLYDDLWYDETDGDGFSLVTTDTGGDYNDRANWRSSALLGGSPGASDLPPAAGDFNGDGLTDRRDAVRLLTNFGSRTGRSRFSGDLNDDGASGITDLALMQAGFGSVAGASPLPSASAVVSFQVSSPQRQEHTITALRRRPVLRIDTSAVDRVLTDQRELFTPAPVRHRLLSVRDRRVAQPSDIMPAETELISAE